MKMVHTTSNITYELLKVAIKDLFHILIAISYTADVQESLSYKSPRCLWHLKYQSPCDKLYNASCLFKFNVYKYSKAQCALSQFMKCNGQKLNQ